MPSSLPPLPTHCPITGDKYYEIPLPVIKYRKIASDLSFKSRAFIFDVIVLIYDKVFVEGNDSMGLLEGCALDSPNQNENMEAIDSLTMEGSNSDTNGKSSAEKMFDLGDSIGTLSASRPDCKLLPSQKASILNSDINNDLIPSKKDELIIKESKQMTNKMKTEYGKRVRSRKWQNLFVKWVRITLDRKYGIGWSVLFGRHTGFCAKFSKGSAGLFDIGQNLLVVYRSTPAEWGLHFNQMIALGKGVSSKKELSTGTSNATTKKAITNTNTNSSSNQVNLKPTKLHILQSRDYSKSLEEEENRLDDEEVKNLNLIDSLGLGDGVELEDDLDDDDDTNANGGEGSNESSTTASADSDSTNNALRKRKVDDSSKDTTTSTTASSNFSIDHESSNSKNAITTLSSVPNSTQAAKKKAIIKQQKMLREKRRIFDEKMQFWNSDKRMESILTRLSQQCDEVWDADPKVLAQNLRWKLTQDMIFEWSAEKDRLKNNSTSESEDSDKITTINKVDIDPTTQLPYAKPDPDSTWHVYVGRDFVASTPSYAQNMILCSTKKNCGTKQDLNSGVKSNKNDDPSCSNSNSSTLILVFQHSINAKNTPTSYLEKSLLNSPLKKFFHYVSPNTWNEYFFGENGRENLISSIPHIVVIIFAVLFLLKKGMCDSLNVVDPNILAESKGDLPVEPSTISSSVPVVNPDAILDIEGSTDSDSKLINISILPPPIKSAFCSTLESYGSMGQHVGLAVIGLVVMKQISAKMNGRRGRK